MIGESGLVGTLYEAGITISDNDPDYVVVGEIANYDYETVCRAVTHVLGDSKLIGTKNEQIVRRALSAPV